jgi:L-lactate dehydrogenase complex protein LldF
MTVDYYAPYKKRVEQALGDRHLSIALTRATDRMVNGRIQSMNAVDGQKLRNQVRQMKEHTLRHLPAYLEQLELNLKSNGAIVHWAKDGEEAARIVREIGLQNGVESVVKAKSMATEEIHLNKALEDVGMKVVETDLGEYIIQINNEHPSHIVAPVIHKRLEDVAQIFQEKMDVPPTLDAEMLCSVARMRLRKDFFEAQMGVIGCNFAIAESGTICIVTNEGNGRMVSSMPRILVAVMGIEKVVPSVEDGILQLQALTRSATGQNFSVYCSMTSGPRKPGQTDGPDQFHVVLMDNGRVRMIERGYGEALLCIRCGACLNVCPVYQEIGGHAYGSTYSGPIGAVITPLLAPELSDAKDLPHATTLCGACRDACPVKIDLPRLLVDLRADLVNEGANQQFEAWAIKGFIKTAESRYRYEQAGKLASIGSNIMAGLSGGNITFMPPPLNAWTQHRDFPPFAKKSFREWWKERQQLRQRD